MMFKYIIIPYLRNSARLKVGKKNPLPQYFFPDLFLSIRTNNTTLIKILIPRHRYLSFSSQIWFPLCLTTSIPAEASLPKPFLFSITALSLLELSHSPSTFEIEPWTFFPSTLGLKSHFWIFFCLWVGGLFSSCCSLKAGHYFDDFVHHKLG